MSGKGSPVYFGSIQHGRAAAFASLAAKVDEIVECLDFSTIEKEDKVAIKMHLGYRDGYQTVPVFFVRRIVDAVKKVGGWPFVTDNPTSVYNAVNRGYTQETCGCPIIPVSGVKDGYGYPVRIDRLGLDEVDLGGALYDADVLIDLTHAKGHGNPGYGGAIKNIAVGSYSAPSRWNKLHPVVHYKSYWDPAKCTPVHAKRLVEACSYNAITYDEEEHNLTVNFHNCSQCMDCMAADKGVGCLQIKQENFAAFHEVMAVAAQRVLETFDEDKRFYLNFLIEITAYCDCFGIALPCVVNDIGVLGSRDIVAIEVATLDLIAKEGLIEKHIPPYFRHANLDPTVDLHPFQRVLGPMKNPYLVTEYAERLGLGSRRYELIEVLSPQETMTQDLDTDAFAEKEPSFY